MLTNEMSRFLEEFRDGNFRHRARLVSGLEDGSATLYRVSEDSKQSTGNLLSTFTVRLRILDKLLLEDFSVEKQSIRDDVDELCDGLRQHLDDLCDTWIFKHSGGGTTCVYVGRQSRKVMGCVSLWSA